MLEDEYPALWQFLGGYLHQDWDLDYGTTSDALHDFMEGSDELATQLPLEMEQVLTTKTDDEVLERFLVELGSCYVPSRAGKNPRTWLRDLQDEARLLTQ